MSIVPIKSYIFEQCYNHPRLIMIKILGVYLVWKGRYFRKNQINSAEIIPNAETCQNFPVNPGVLRKSLKNWLKKCNWRIVDAMYHTNHINTGIIDEYWLSTILLSDNERNERRKIPAKLSSFIRIHWVVYIVFFKQFNGSFILKSDFNDESQDYDGHTLIMVKLSLLRNIIW